MSRHGGERPSTVLKPDVRGVRAHSSLLAALINIINIIIIKLQQIKPSTQVQSLTHEPP